MGAAGSLAKLLYHEGRNQPYAPMWDLLPAAAKSKPDHDLSAICGLLAAENLLGHMSTASRVLVFGVVSGMIWSVVPGTLSELFRSPGETITVAASGALTGVLVSFTLRTLLSKSGRWGAFAFGILALPLGAFAFGVLISLVQWMVKDFTGVAYRFVANGFSPFRSGFEYAVFSVISIFGCILLPLSILTTFLLRAVIVADRRHDHEA
ncbi:MAG: hypothetical protein JWR26_907 [Pedosphaera sp.]|nr:hypothetical protein [Pedosphaera sp.]